MGFRQLVGRLVARFEVPHVDAVGKLLEKAYTLRVKWRELPEPAVRRVDVTSHESSPAALGGVLAVEQFSPSVEAWQVQWDPALVELPREAPLLPPDLSVTVAELIARDVASEPAATRPPRRQASRSREGQVTPLAVYSVRCPVQVPSPAEPASDGQRPPGGAVIELVGRDGIPRAPLPRPRRRQPPAVLGMRFTFDEKASPQTRTIAVPEIRHARRQPRTKRATTADYRRLSELLLPLLWPPPIVLRRPSLQKLPSPLYPFQVEGVKFLVERQSALLADDMGLGKTVQALVALAILFYTGAIRRAVIVVPPSVLRQWRAEMRRWTPQLLVSVCHGPNRHINWSLPAHVYLTTYDTGRNDIQRIFKLDPDLVLLDEAQYIKNPDSKRSRAYRALQPHIRWALTGTPLENRVLELQAVFAFVAPGLLPLYEELDPATARNRVAQYVLRRRKEDVLHDLPPKVTHTVELELTPAQWLTYEEAYERGRSRLKALGDQVTRQHIFAVLHELKQICNVDPDSGESCKIEWLSEFLTELRSTGEKALIYSQYLKAGVDLIIDTLGREHHLLKIVGGMSQQRRSAAVDRFQQADDVRALVMTFKAGGIGLNLTAANYVVHFDQWWNPAVLWQAEDRAHRLGQQKPVFVYRLVTADTIEERVLQILARKEQLFQDVVDSLAKSPEELLTFEELLSLFDLEPPDKRDKQSQKGVTKKRRQSRRR